MISFNGKHFIYDIFIRDDKLILISTYYAKSDPPVKLYVNDVEFANIGYNWYEPTRFFVGLAPVDPNITVRIESPGIPTVEQKLIAEYVDKSCGVMAVATLFKNDYKRIPIFCSYYRTQGVEKFFLYYNGPTLPEDIYKADDIEYRCWNFPYWNTGAPLTDTGGNTQWRHNAQLTFLSSMALRNIPRYRWFGLVDLDELVHHPEKQLLEYLDTEIPKQALSVTIRNHWAKRIDMDRILYTLIPLPVEAGRTKVFYRSSYIGLCGIHAPKNMKNNDVSTALCLIHYVDDIEPDSSSSAERLRDIVEPTAILVLPPRS